jgi:hypothetical protein
LMLAARPRNRLLAVIAASLGVRVILAVASTVARHEPPAPNLGREICPEQEESDRASH